MPFLGQHLFQEAIMRPFSELLSLFTYFYLRVVETQWYMGFRYTTEIFDRFTHYTMFTPGVATVCLLASLLPYH